MSRGMYQDEYEWAVQHPGEEEAKTLLTLAGMYSRFREHCTYGLIQAAVDRIRRTDSFNLWKSVERLT